LVNVQSTLEAVVGRIVRHGKAPRHGEAHGLSTSRLVMPAATASPLDGHRNLVLRARTVAASEYEPIWGITRMKITPRVTRPTSPRMTERRRSSPRRGAARAALSGPPRIAWAADRWSMVHVVIAGRATAR
jgi:hypothetical protein